jgi:hypothetical protein
MRHRQPAEEVVQEAVTLAQQLPERQQGRVLGPILGLAYHYLGEAILNRLANGGADGNQYDAGILCGGN